MQLIGDAIVLADEQRVQAGQFDVLVGSNIAGHEQMIVGHQVRVVRDRKRGGIIGIAILMDPGEIILVVVRQQIVAGADDAVGTRAGLEVAARVSPQCVGDVIA